MNKSGESNVGTLVKYSNSSYLFIRLINFNHLNLGFEIYVYIKTKTMKRIHQNNFDCLVFNICKREQH